MSEHDDFIDELQRNIPQEWEASEGSAESIVIDYVRALEKRVTALGGHLNPYDGGQTQALGEFYRAARKQAAIHVTNWDAFTAACNETADAWDAYVQIKAEAE
jgi:hypothetical protein